MTQDLQPVFGSALIIPCRHRVETGHWAVIQSEFTKATASVASKELG